MKIIHLKSEIKPSALETAMGYRGVSSSKLCKEIKGLTQEDLAKFLKGSHGTIPENKLKEIMIFLEFPFGFLYKEFKPIKYSHKF